MFDVVEYRYDLLIYIIMVSILALIVILLINGIFLILKISNKFDERKVWISVNILLLVLFILLISSAFMDFSNSSFCEITNVKKIEQSSDTSTQIDRFAGSRVLITTENGMVYICHDSIFDFEKLETIQFPCTIVYAKHSKLLLDCY